MTPEIIEQLNKLIDPKYTINDVAHTKNMFLIKLGIVYLGKISYMPTHAYAFIINQWAEITIPYDDPGYSIKINLLLGSYIP